MNKSVYKKAKNRVWLVLASALLIALPFGLDAELTATFTGCPCNGGSWPSVTFSFTNNASYSVTMDGFRFKTPSYNGYACFGGGTMTKTGAGPVQWEQMLADWDRIRNTGSTLNTYSCGGSVPAGQDGTPYDVQLLVKEGACNPPNPISTPPAITCAQVDAVRGGASYYSTACITDYLGKNGGPDSGGVLDTFFGQTQIQVGLTGTYTLNMTNVKFDPSAMGSPMYMMAVSSSQELLNFDMQYLMAIGGKETMVAMVQVPGSLLYPSFYTNGEGAYGPWEVEDATFAVVEQCYPNFFPKYACIAGFANVTAAIGSACYPTIAQAPTYYMTTPGYIGAHWTSAQLVNSAFASALNFYRMYQSLALSTDLCFFNLLENGNDPKAAAKILPAGYNLGINSGFEAGALPPSAGVLAATDITPFTMVGNSGYRDSVMTNVTQIENAASCSGATIYDEAITLTHVQDYLFGNGGTAAAPTQGGLWQQFTSLYNGSAARTALWNDVTCAFTKLQGQVPVAQRPAGYSATTISFRYDWLTLLRVIKQHLALAIPYPTQSDFTAWVKARSINSSACGSTIDKTYPTLAITSPNANTPTSQCNGFTVNFTGSDNVLIKSAQWTLDPTWLNWNSATGGGPYSAAIPQTDANYPSPGGTGKVWIKITDDCGNATIQLLTWIEQCATPTFTATPTRTNTATQTATFTSTATRTPTFTSTVSNTFTFTNTPTNTWTSTFTNTPIITNTFTNTFTVTLTSTFTDTYTPTNTSTLTFTRTFTPTETPTGPPPPTWTYTNTFTNTPTFTSTLTRTPTNTHTETYTHTWTNTPTMTFTQTETRTPTFTRTPTNTPTMTFTPGPTPANLTIELASTGGTPRVGVVVEYTITVRNNDTIPAYNLSVWDSLPANLKYVSTLQGTLTQQNGNYVNWQLGSGDVINPGEVRVIRFTAQIVSIVDKAAIVNRVTMDYNDQAFSLPAKNGPHDSQDNYYPGNIPIVYPNPFNRETAGNNVLKIVNLVPGSKIQIFTVSGESVVALKADSYKAYWDGKNRYQAFAAAGVYYYIVTTPQKQIYKGKLYIVAPSGK